MTPMSTAHDLMGRIHGVRISLPGGTVWEASHEYPGVIQVSLVEPTGCDHLILLATPDWSNERELHVYLEHAETGVRPDIEDDLFEDAFVDDPDRDKDTWTLHVMRYLKKHEQEVLAHCGAKPRPSPSPDLELINRHRARIGQAALDPTAVGWGPEDLAAEARRIRRLNPGTLKRSLLR